MVYLFENLLSARAVIDSLSSIVSIDHFKTGAISNFIPKKFQKKNIEIFTQKNVQKMIKKLISKIFVKKIFIR